MNKNLIGELSIMDSMDIKPNYAALGRKYGMDWRTVKKYHEGYQGKPGTRNKGSKLDKYKDEMTDKLSIRRVSVRGVYEFLVKSMALITSVLIQILIHMSTKTNLSPVKL